MCDISTKKIIDRGRITLREEKANSTQQKFGTKEYIDLVLGRCTFLVRGLESDDGFLHPSGYIVKVDKEGKEIRKKIAWGMWPEKRLNDDLFVAFEY